MPLTAQHSTTVGACSYWSHWRSSAALILGVALALAVGVAKAQAGRAVFDSNLTQQNWLSASSRSSSAQRADLVIGRYNVQSGLLAAYQDASGVRLLLSSEQSSGNRMAVTVLAWDPDSQRMMRVIYPRGAPAGKSPSLIVDGVDVIAALEHHVRTKTFRPNDRARLRQFSASKTGTALMDAVAALYLQLDEWETDQRIVSAKASLGVLRGTIEMISGHYQGIDRLDQLAGSDKVIALRGACADGRCSLRSNQFLVHQSGFFDVWSVCGSKKGAHLPISNATPVGISNIYALNGVLDRCARNAATGGFGDDCFGACGAGCTGSLYLPECCGHDSCVVRYGHLACMFGTPEMCEPPCNSLIEAFLAWWRARASMIEQ